MGEANTIWREEFHPRPTTPAPVRLEISIGDAPDENGEWGYFVEVAYLDGSTRGLGGAKPVATRAEIEAHATRQAVRLLCAELADLRAVVDAQRGNR